MQEVQDLLSAIATSDSFIDFYSNSVAIDPTSSKIKKTKKGETRRRTIVSKKKITKARERWMLLYLIKESKLVKKPVRLVKT